MLYIELILFFTQKVFYDPYVLVFLFVLFLIFSFKPTFPTQKANNILDIILICRFITQTQAFCRLLASQPTLCRKNHYFLSTEGKLRLKGMKDMLRDEKA